MVSYIWTVISLLHTDNTVQCFTLFKALVTDLRDQISWSCSVPAIYALDHELDLRVRTFGLPLILLFLLLQPLLKLIHFLILSILLDMCTKVLMTESKAVT